MKEKVIIIATILIIVISFPFLAVQSEKTAKVRDEELREQETGAVSKSSIVYGK